MPNFSDFGFSIRCYSLLALKVKYIFFYSFLVAKLALIFFLKIHTHNKIWTFFLYWWCYSHRLRNLVFPICQYSKSWVFKLSLVFFTATVHLQHYHGQFVDLRVYTLELKLLEGKTLSSFGWKIAEDLLDKFSNLLIFGSKSCRFCQGQLLDYLIAGSSYFCEHS